MNLRGMLLAAWLAFSLTFVAQAQPNDRERKQQDDEARKKLAKQKEDDNKRLADQEKESQRRQQEEVIRERERQKQNQKQNQPKTPGQQQKELDDALKKDIYRLRRSRKLTHPCSPELTHRSQ